MYPMFSIQYQVGILAFGQAIRKPASALDYRVLAVEKDNSCSDY
jgi:hypothetical protein